MAGRERPATHAGSWYSEDGRALGAQLDGWIQAAGGPARPPPVTRAIIAPHAGYSYSGPSAAFAYRALDPAVVRRVFVMGPSHHYHTRSCEVSGAASYATPVGPLQVDQAVVRDLLATGHFGTMSGRTEGDEHSIEMHMPYIARVFQGRQVTVVPILVGSLSHESEAKFGRILAPYLDDPANFFVASSDFCHWGSRFSYTHYDKTKGDIWQSIEALDRLGMQQIEAQSPEAFQEYLEEFSNTICGRHPITVLMYAMKAARTKFQTRFVHYAQSSKCRSAKDSSVSYAAALVQVADDREPAAGGGGGR